MKVEKMNQILLCSCVFLLGINGFTALSVETSTEIVENEEILVTNLSVAQLGSLSLKHDHLTLGILTRRDQFEFISDADHDFGLSEIRSLVYSLCNIKGIQEFSDSSLWKDFGDENPQSTMILTDFKGEKFEFSLLKTMEDYCYLYDHQRDTVFLVDGLVGRLMLSESEDFYQKSLFPVINGSNYQYIESVSVEYAKGGRDYLLTQDQGKFYLKEPISYKIPVVNALSQLVTRLSALYADEVVEMGADWEDYQVEERHDLKVTMKTLEEEITVYFLPEEGESFLMAWEETGDIFRIYGDFTHISQDYNHLFQGKVLQFAMGDVEKMVLTQGIEEIQGGKTFVLEMGKDGTPLVGGQPWEQEKYQDFITSLNSLEIKGEMSESSDFSGTMALDVYYRDGDREKILFSKPENGLVSVSVNGLCYFMTSEKSFCKILENMT